MSYHYKSMKKPCNAPYAPYHSQLVLLCLRRDVRARASRRFFKLTATFSALAAG